MSYWAQSFFADQDGNYSCTVVTATPQKGELSSVFFVEDRKDHFADRFIQGISWVSGLKAFFDCADLSFDYAIISGGPFGHFGIGRYLKKRFACKVILDFRDPFAGNRRFDSSLAKEAIKLLFEKYFLKKADFVVTVNEHCRQLLAKNFPVNRIEVIENGYDERDLNLIHSSKFEDGLVHIVYAGTFYRDRDPTQFIKQLVQANKANQRFVLHHIGRPSDFLTPFSNDHSIRQHGEKSYKQTLELMSRCDLGLIITGGEPMESTTKIYDYIGCNLGILVVTNGSVKTGSINAITSRIDGKVFWVRNTNSELRFFLRDYETEKKTITNREDFSRYQGYQKVKRLLWTI